jgi:membrane protease YdiL (CAAX protease family)
VRNHHALRALKDAGLWTLIEVVVTGVFGSEPDLETGIREAGVAVATLCVVSNGFLAPIVEEYVWRGTVQRNLRVACFNSRAPPREHGGNSALYP